MKALAIAATGMSAQQLNVQVIANNIANINTTAFKRSRAEFTDLTYQVERLQGVPNRGRDNPVPEGSRLGLGVRSAAIRNLHLQGTMANTGNSYDLAINGRGWFQIQGPNAQTLYTRAGAFNVNADSQLVTADGYEIEPAIIVPDKTIQVTINETGQVYA
jgi:flagellar basal-body rod protein FlgG